MFKFKINEKFAKKYDEYRKKEELQKLKDKYGDEVLKEDDNDSSSSESEDEDAKGLTPRAEKAFFRALSCLKKDDPKIYKNDVNFYEEGDDSSSDSSRRNKKTKPEKPLYPKDYERNILLVKKGVFEDDEVLTSGTGKLSSAVGTSYNEEQKKIKEGFKSFLEDSDHEDIDEDQPSGFLTKRKRTTEDKEAEEADFHQWLQEEGESATHSSDDDFKQDVNYLKTFWHQPDLEDSEKFLRDYILNKEYLDKDDMDRIPTYEEVVASEDEEESDDDFLEKQDDFERKFNFRYEEPDADTVKFFPRKISDTVRSYDNRRSVKRQEVKERKEKEKAEKSEEVKQMKNLMKQEILDKVEKIRVVSGVTDRDLSQLDVDGDFDPAAYDSMMKNMFDDTYFKECPDNQKPQFTDDDIIDGNDDIITENWDDWTGREELDPPLESADDEPGGQESAGHKNSASDDKNKRRSFFAQAVCKTKPVFDPVDKSFEQYFDQYYKLDFEDVIGDVKCRFKYRPVAANDFGLSVDEVLAADEKELNQWCSLRKTMQYRSKDEEEKDLIVYRKKSKKPENKYKILTSLRERELQREEQRRNSQQPKKRKKKELKISEPTEEPTTKTPKLVPVEATSVKTVPENPQKTSKPTTTGAAKGASKKRRRNRKKGNEKKRGTGKRIEAPVTDGRLKAYGIKDTRKFKFKLMNKLRQAHSK